MNIQRKSTMYLDGPLVKNADRNEFTHTEETTAQSDVLTEAAGLLYDLMNSSFQCSSTCLEVEINGHQMDIQSLYWDCRNLLKQIESAGSKAGFLSMSVLEQTWRRTKPLLLCCLEDLMNPAKPDPVAKAIRLEQIFSDNVYAKMWAERSSLYTSILEKAGFDTSKANFSDLTSIMDPLLDALGFYSVEKRPPAIYRVRSGEMSGKKDPVFAQAMCKYQSEKELADAVMGSGQDCLVAFGAVEKTHAQVKDYFYEWFRGVPDERQRNITRNEQITDEEYLTMPCDYTRKVYLVVKSGGTCWLMPMPWKGDMYRKIGDKESEYIYGKRASYAPYQIFYKDALASAPEGSTMLAIPKKGYLLTELMDAPCMAWFPAFMDETVKYFLKSESGPANTADMIFPEEAIAELPGTSGDNPCVLVPVWSGVPAVSSYTYKIRNPLDVFKDNKNAEWLLKLFQYFNVSADDIKSAPLLPSKMGDAKAYDELIDENLKKAYIKVLAERIAEFMRGRWSARRWMYEKTRSRIGEIIADAGDGKLMEFMECIVEGTPILDKDGKPIIKVSNRYPYAKHEERQHVDPDDARDRSNPDKNMSSQVFWACEPTSGKPPVVWKVRPSKPEHYAALAGCELSELPIILSMCDKLKTFYDTYKDVVPGDLTNKYAAVGVGYSAGMDSIYVPCMGRVNICMNKKTMRQFPFFKNDGASPPKNKNKK